jgi:hypothetical protein
MEIRKWVLKKMEMVQEFPRLGGIAFKVLPPRRDRHSIYL